MLYAKLVIFSMSTMANWSLFKDDAFSNPILYHNIIGSLQHLSFTRSNIAFVDNKVHQYMS